jgi:Domain of unknown function (DUF4440)
MPGNSVRDSVQAFFTDFERASAALDLTALGEMFADVFLNLSPTSAGPVTREEFTDALPMRERLFASIDATAMTLTRLSETVLDDMHTLAETQWRVQFGPDSPPGRNLTLSSAFLLRRQDQRWRVVAYLNHQDILAVVGTLRDQPSPTAASG